MEKAIQMQSQVRQNAEELKDFIRDIDAWTDSVKKKDQKLLEQKHGTVTEEKDLPPVRNSAQRPKKKKKKDKTIDVPKSADVKKKKKLKGYDYRAWDKFDVEKECAALDSDNEENDKDSEYETDSEAEMEAERKRQEAALEKDRGNAFFKQGKYQEAVQCYTTGIECDPYSAILPANRAMAYLKMKKYENAETDCTTALSIDYTYVKAYHRRGTARIELDRLEDAKKDFEQVLNLEPSNKQAVTELKRIQKLTLMKEEEARKQAEKDALAIVKPVEKKSHERSKKPLKRMVIEEIGDDVVLVEEEEERKQNAANKQTPPETSEKVATNSSDLRPVQFSSPADILAASSTNAEPCVNGKVQELPEKDRNNVSSTGNKTEDLVSTAEVKTSKEDSKTTPQNVPIPVSSQIPAIPDCPSTSYQLQTDWRKLQNYPLQLYQYFKSIPPASYPKLFQQSLDSGMLNKILLLLRDNFIVNEDPIFDILHHLSEVKRFSMNVMFMSSTEKQVVNDLFSYMESRLPDKAAEIKLLSKKYGL
ncbi:RNA polymerase II-associated protein 3-like [Ptychodera flava]|uniref:RNA polymerase II-associated protein 3-like n=1 Tax=Ptychodera flava TaxID=63121 RepID=UPI00396A02A9